MKIKIQKVRKNCILPSKTHPSDSGFDCFISLFKSINYAISTDRVHVEKSLPEHEYSSFILEPMGRVACCLGFKTEIPKGYYCEVVPRSGNALWKGLTITNSPGIIDSGYRGEWIAIASNTSRQKVQLSIGDKISQFIVKKMVDAVLEEVDSLEESERGDGGFGSTGN